MIKKINDISFLPRWIILLIDLLLLMSAIVIAYLLRFNFNLADVLAFKFTEGLVLFLICHLISIFLTQSYAGIIRYTSIEDGLRISYTTFIGTILIAIISYLNYWYRGSVIIPASVLIISFILSVSILFSYRVLVKNLFSYYRDAVRNRKNIIIFGAGQYGIITKQVIDADPNARSRVVGFIDDDIKKSGKILNGTPIFDANYNLDEILKKYAVREIIIAIANLSVERKNELVDYCLKAHVKVRSVPPPEKWVNGELSINQIKEVRIEDLLGRESIQLQNPKVSESIAGKIVLITGAAGSIGSEIAKQVLKVKPKKLLILDQAESFLYAVDLDLVNQNKDKKVEITPLIVDVTNKRRLEGIFEKYNPDIVYHAAAYKHVPLMEKHPVEAIATNVFGTKNLADLAVQYNVEKFVMVSTDKAVNPTNVMGATKRLAELYVQSLNDVKADGKKNTTKFVTTRFGNVLGSNGSVIPLFKNQIEKGGPVTVTHPDVTRYFMTIPEACQLVIEAGVMGFGGEIFVFDMGKSVKIIDLAKKMIQLSGFEVGVDINIEYTGLREGEKLYEELLSNKETTLPTYHEKILIAKTDRMRHNEISSELSKLYDLLLDENEMGMIMQIKKIIPEFISHASRFEVLDDKDSDNGKWKISRKIS
ncbi:polysaccharide biosynthesis protein [Marivirga arenosa]|uniref:Nucleoside-diphosphate sugar epimerase/dehydratase n=1 Tax=Marivirga arenosa TaxID=3059076 RepID=A0AA52F0X2_9BACT|nr:nucleoside-diphosphate sugar epimerase/dehydratase [Marivirga sp. BKB1-2]WNB18518.1 nucleoside-diphosphate sugar epimerase/dehydratase [Marivirga sp. BKB1-2]